MIHDLMMSSRLGCTWPCCAVCPAAHLCSNTSPVLSRVVGERGLPKPVPCAAVPKFKNGLLRERRYTSPVLSSVRSNTKQLARCRTLRSAWFKAVLRFRYFEHAACAAIPPLCCPPCAHVCSRKRSNTSPVLSAVHNNKSNLCSKKCERESYNARHAFCTKMQIAIR